MLQQLLGLNRRWMKAYLLKESLDRLWNHRLSRSHDALPAAMDGPADQLRWQRLKPMEKLADMLVKGKR
jgi:hypothetical protein